MIRKVSLLLFALLALSAGMILAGEDEAEGKKVHNKPPEQGEKKAHNMGAGGLEMTFTGKLVCMGCSLKADGARSDCAAFGHDHALMITSGRFINFLPNKFGKALMAGGEAHNKEVTVTGGFFAKANMLDVKTFQIEDGPTNQWCHGHEGMDACATPK